MVTHISAPLSVAAACIPGPVPAMAGNQLPVALSGYYKVSHHIDAPVPGEARIHPF